MDHIEIISIEFKKQKITKNPNNRNDNRRFQYAITVALNHQEIGKTNDK